MTTGIPPALYRRIEDVLLQCGPFDNFTELKAIFTDARISPWHKEVRDANTAAARVQVNVDFLRRQYNAVQENGLVLLLRVLSDAKDETDACQSELTATADDLEQWLHDKRALSQTVVPRKSLRNRVAMVGSLLFTIAIAIWFLLINHETPSEVLPTATLATLPQCPTATHDAGEDFDAAMVFITGTVLLMGDDTLMQPTHKVTVATFLLDRFEVTNLQYRRFIITTNRRPPDTWKGNDFPTGKAFHPVAGITWLDASAYCEWVGKRLPYEVEWELACRGTQNTLYPWGEEPQQNLANADGDSGCGQTLAVGGYSSRGDSTYGVADMVGNVAEWVNSIFMDYPYRHDDGREDAANEEAYRVIRGGAFDLPLFSCAERMNAPPAIAIPDVGFRCAQDVAPSP
jgi:formylglycine-generating enzyme required for sulfatase activity